MLFSRIRTSQAWISICIGINRSPERRGFRSQQEEVLLQRSVGLGAALEENLSRAKANKLHPKNG